MKNIYILSEFAELIQTPFDLCLAFVGETFPDNLEELLGPLEEKEGRLRRNPAARRQWLAGRLAAKSAAAHKWGLPPALIEIINGAEGEPLLGLAGRDSGSARVSISHTGGAAVAAVADGPVGVDLERLDRNINDRVWQWAFSPDEQRLAAPPRKASASQPVGPDFNRAGGKGLDGRPGFDCGSAPWPARLSFWCAREAASKYWRLPLLNNLDQIRVSGVDWAGGRLEVSRPGPEHQSIEVHLLGHRDWLLALAGGGRNNR